MSYFLVLFLLEFFAIRRATSEHVRTCFILNEEAIEYEDETSLHINGIGDMCDCQKSLFNSIPSDKTITKINFGD